jgi:hypothetical protein
VVWETRKEAGAGQVTVYLPGELAWLSEVEEVIGEGPREEWVLDQPLCGLRSFICSGCALVWGEENAAPQSLG